MRFLVPAATAVFLALIASANGACATGQDPTGAGDDGTGDGTDSGSDSGENLPPDTDNPDSGSVKKLGSDSGSGTQSGTRQRVGAIARQRHDRGARTADRPRARTAAPPRRRPPIASARRARSWMARATRAPATPSIRTWEIAIRAHRVATTATRLNGTGGIATYCCFNPKTSSNCYKDYGGAQCVPQ